MLLITWWFLGLFFICQFVFFWSLFLVNSSFVPFSKCSVHRSLCCHLLFTFTGCSGGCCKCWKARNHGRIKKTLSSSSHGIRCSQQHQNHLERRGCGRTWGCPGDGRWSRPGSRWAGSLAVASCGSRPGTGEPLAGGSRSWRSERAWCPWLYHTPQWRAWRAATEGCETVITRTAWLTDTDGKRRRYSNSKLSQSEYLCKTDLADSANSECLSVRSAMYETVLHLKGKDLLFQPLQQRLLCTAHLKALLHCDSHRSLLRSFCKQLWYQSDS